MAVYVWIREPKRVVFADVIEIAAGLLMVNITRSWLADGGQFTEMFNREYPSGFYGVWLFLGLAALGQGIGLLFRDLGLAPVFRIRVGATGLVVRRWPFISRTPLELAPGDTLEVSMPLCPREGVESLVRARKLRLSVGESSVEAWVGDVDVERIADDLGDQLPGIAVEFVAYSGEPQPTRWWE